ncbi:MAG TPA: phosphatase PAP2 family protein [Chitinophagaceae bacterium]
MELKSHTRHEHFRIAVITSITFIVVFALFLFIYGKKDSFVLINGFYDPKLDYFFQYVTYLGDGLIYIPIVVYCLFWNQKYLVPVIAGIIICTVLTHFLKRVVFPDELRPISLEVEKVIIHKVEGVPVHRQHSFPSGHTSTAFTVALLLVSVMKRKIWAFILPMVAFLVGYSRVYLAQHFVTDVTVGMLIGIISAYLALLIYDRYELRLARKQAELDNQVTASHPE